MKTAPKGNKRQSLVVADGTGKRVRRWRGKPLAIRLAPGEPVPEGYVGIPYLGVVNAGPKDNPQ